MVSSSVAERRAELSLRRLNKLFVPSEVIDSSPASLSERNNFLAGLAKHGFVLNHSSLEVLRRVSPEWLQTLSDVVADFREGQPGFAVFYRDFADFVPNANELELFFNAWTHYVETEVLGESVLPSEGVVGRQRPLLKGVVDSFGASSATVWRLGVADVTDLSVFTARLVSQGQPFSDTDIADLRVLAEFAPEVGSVEVSVRENRAVLAALWGGEWVMLLDSVSDVLRFAVALSSPMLRPKSGKSGESVSEVDGLGVDVSLASPSRIRLSRPARLAVLETLESVVGDAYESDTVAQAMEDGFRHEGIWKRVAYALHYHNTPHFRYASTFLSQLQSGVRTFQSFNSRIELLLLNADDCDSVLLLLAERPGEFARRLAHVLRVFPERRADIVDMFKTVAGRVSVRVLVQMWNLFSGPDNTVLPRTVALTKSAGMIVKENRLHGSYKDVVAAIEYGLSQRKDEGKPPVSLIERRNDPLFTVPLGLRHASPQLRAVGRGTRTRFGDEFDTVRAFMFWRNQPTRRVDLDLSAVLCSEDFTTRQEIAFFELRSQEAYHSGDIVDAPHGASEFIDVNIDKAVANGYRYLLVDVISFTGQPLSEVPDASAGVMLRNGVNSGEDYEPSTVATKFDLTADTVQVAPVVFDLVTREMVWIDLPVGHRRRWASTVAGSQDLLSDVLRQAVLGSYMQVSDLAWLTRKIVLDGSGEALDPAITVDALTLLDD